MNHKSYLKYEIPKFVEIHKNNKYWYSYNLTRMRRFLAQTLMIFVFQYMTIINLTFSYPALPMYPPIGIAFVMFTLLGNNALLGLLLGGLFGYLLKGLAIETTVLYLIADIGGGYIGSLLCQSVFSSDIRPFLNIHEGLKFLKINAFITCLISSLIRTGAVLLSYNVTFYDCIDLWFSDLNAILILSGFLLSWSYTPFSREKISDKTITITPIVGLIIFILISIFFMKKFELIYLITTIMMASIYFAYNYGYLIATALLFITSAIYLSHFIALKQQYVSYFGLELYTLIPLSLFIFTICILYAGHLRLRLKPPIN